jgi:hypothetical protein
MEFKNGWKKNGRKARRLQGRTEKKGQYLSDRVEYPESRQSGDGSGIKPIRGDREIRQRSNGECKPSASEADGGVISQLLSEERERLARLYTDLRMQEERIELLEATLIRLNEISESTEDE